MEKGFNNGKRQKTAATSNLRRRAEDKLKAMNPQTPNYAQNNSMQRLNHELQVNQIELELQNSELPDFAPSGYVTLERSGIIRSVNLSFATGKTLRIRYNKTASSTHRRRNRKGDVMDIRGKVVFVIPDPMSQDVDTMLQKDAKQMITSKVASGYP